MARLIAVALAFSFLGIVAVIVHVLRGDSESGVDTKAPSGVLGSFMRLGSTEPARIFAAMALGLLVFLPFWFAALLMSSRDLGGREALGAPGYVVLFGLAGSLAGWAAWILARRGSAGRRLWLLVALAAFAPLFWYPVIMTIGGALTRPGPPQPEGYMHEDDMDPRPTPGMDFR